MKKKKTFILKAILIGENAPDFGSGKGVLATQELEFTDERNRGFNSPLFEVSRIRHQDNLLAELVRFEWSEKRRRRK